MPPTDADKVFREFRRYTGDGLPGEPVGAPLPIGDPSSGVANIEKRDIRKWANDFQSLADVGGNLEEVRAARLAAETARDKSRDWSESPEDVAVEPGEFSALHHAAKASAQRGLAETARDKSRDWSENPEGVAVEPGEFSARHHAAQSERYATAAEAVRDTAFINADVFASTALGLAGTILGEQFQVILGDEVVRYRHNAGPVAMELTRYPASEKVKKLADEVQAVRQIEEPEWRFAVTNSHGQVYFGLDANDSLTAAHGVKIDDTILKTPIVELPSSSPFALSVVDEWGRIGYGIGASSTGGTAGGGVPVIDGVAYFPKPSGLIHFDFETKATLPTAKGPKIEGTATLIIEGAVLKTRAVLSVSGSSSAAWPKKTWKVKFYDPGPSGLELKIQIGDTAASNGWVIKADWVDPTLARSYASFRLWEQMSEARDGLPKYDTDNSWWGKAGVNGGVMLGGIGAPRPLITNTTINGVFYGLGVMMMKDEPAAYSIDPNNPNHIYFEYDYNSGSWLGFASSKIDADGSTDGYIQWNAPEWDDIDGSVKTTIRQLIDDAGYTLNNSQATFDANCSTYFDEKNLIDYLLFVEAIHDFDGMARDSQFVSYDLQKLYLLPWDKDTTFGVHYNNSGIYYGPTANLINLTTQVVTQTPFYRIYKKDPAAVNARYADLRNKGVFSVENLYRIIEECSRIIPRELRAAEFEKWEFLLDGVTPRSAVYTASTYQMLNWFEGRLAFLDTKYSY